MSARLVSQYDRRIGECRKFWLVDVVVPGMGGRKERVRRVAPVASEAAARDWERRLRVELSAAAARSNDPSLRAFVEKRFLPVYPVARANRPSTRREKEIHFRCHILPALGEVSLEKLDDAAIDRFTASLVKGGLAPKSVANILTTLGTVLRAAVSWGALAACPTIRKPRCAEVPVAYYTPDEAARLVDGASSALDYAVLLFALHTGARAGEILALRWEDLDLERDLVTFRRSETRGIEGPPKSGRARTVPLTLPLAETLRRLVRQGARVFAKPDAAPLTLHDLHGMLTCASTRSGVRRLNVHALRHSFATHLSAAGVPVRHIQAWLGHSDVRIVLRYLHIASASTSIDVLAHPRACLPPGLTHDVERRALAP